MQSEVIKLPQQRQTKTREGVRSGKLKIYYYEKRITYFERILRNGNDSSR